MSGLPVWHSFFLSHSDLVRNTKNQMPNKNVIVLKNIQDNLVMYLKEFCVDVQVILEASLH